MATEKGKQGIGEHSIGTQKVESALTSAPSTLQSDQNVLTFHVGDNVTVVPRKEYYGIRDIGVAIGSADRQFVQKNYFQARIDDPSITFQESGTGKSNREHRLDEKNFQKVVAAIIPKMDKPRRRRMRRYVHSPLSQDPAK